MRSPRLSGSAIFLSLQADDVDDAMVANKIWGDSVPRLKGSTVRETGKRKPQSLVKVPRELIQLQWKVRIGIDIFFVVLLSSFPRCIAFFETFQLQPDNDMYDLTILNGRQIIGNLR